MSDTLDSVPGSWTLWMRKPQDTAAATFQATFTNSGDASSGNVTVGGNSGQWQETEEASSENIKFTIEDPEGSGHTYTFSGFMVGLAAGGTFKEASAILPIPAGAWSAYKTSDPA